MDYSKEKFDIIIQGGQSNAEGYGRGKVDSPYIPNEQIFYLNNTDYTWDHPNRIFTYTDAFAVQIAKEWEFAGNPEDTCGDFSLSFAQEYIKRGYLQADRKILVVRAAVGGTGFYDHIWGVNDPLGERLYKMTEYALSLNPENRIIAFLWHQGEDDVCLGNPVANYYSQLKALFDKVREKFGNMPLIAGDFAHAWKDYLPAEPIRNIIRKVISDCGNGYFVETNGLSSNSQVLGDTDAVHFSKEGIYELGKRYFNAFMQLKNNKD